MSPAPQGAIEFIPRGAAPAPLEPKRAVFGDERPAIAIPRPALLFVLVVGQAVLARLIFLAPRLGMVQAAVMIGMVLFAAVRRDAQLCLVLAAYIGGAEIVWRQARASVPYQLGPYLMIMLSVLAVLLIFPAINSTGRKALLYIGLLVPSAAVTVSATAGNARQLLAFSLAGPTAIAALVVWLSQTAVAPWLYRRVLWALAISGVGPLTIAATNLNDYLGTGEQLTFSNASNFTASGGFGPVQVSSVLGLTVLACVILVLVEIETTARALAAAVGVAAGVQSLLTFSRGGMFATAFAVAGLALAQTTNREGRRRVGAIIVAIFALGYFVIVPRIDSFTQGAFTERFTDSETGRTDLATNDIEVFKRHALFGVGPGMTKYQRLSYDVCRLRSDACKDEASSHTEFTRMMSEHGSIGVLSIVILLSMAWTAVVRGGPSRFLSVSFVVWALAQMFYANVRVVAVAFAFGLAFVRVVDEEPPPPEPDPDPDPHQKVPGALSLTSRSSPGLAVRRSARTEATIAALREDRESMRRRTEPPQD